MGKGKGVNIVIVHLQPRCMKRSTLLFALSSYRFENWNWRNTLITSSWVGTLAVKSQKRNFSNPFWSHWELNPLNVSLSVTDWIRTFKVDSQQNLASQFGTLMTSRTKTPQSSVLVSILNQISSSETFRIYLDSLESQRRMSEQKHLKVSNQSEERQQE